MPVEDSFEQAARKAVYLIASLALYAASLALCAAWWLVSWPWRAWKRHQREKAQRAYLTCDNPINPELRTAPRVA